MAKKIYSESIKKWLLASGVSGGTLVGGIFLYLFMIGAISNVSYSEDMTCMGTVDDPCFAYINFTANEDIFIYPVGYDPWGRNSTFNFDPNVREWHLYRSWGSGWREINLSTNCKGTWCGASDNSGDTSYSVAFRKGKTYQIRLMAYKYNPKEDIKWGAFTGVDEIDPEWIGETDKLTLLNSVEAIDLLRTYDSVESVGELTKEYYADYKRLVIKSEKEEIINFSLESDYNNLVGVGKDTLVAEFLINDFSKDYDLNDLDIGFYDSKNKFVEMSKNFKFKYKETYYKEDCLTDEETNKTKCEKVPRERWIDFDSLSELPNKKIEVGIFTDTNPDETVEWVISLEGFDLLEWASYTTPDVFSNFDDKSIYFQNWNYTSYDYGRIRIIDTDAHSGAMSIGMDSTSGYSLNEFSTGLDFTGATDVNLSFWYRGYAEELTSGADHSGTYNGDAVYYTCNGTYWYDVYDFANPSTWTQVNLTLSDDPDWCGTATSDFRIKWTQYDNSQINSDGIGLDDIYITTDVEMTFINETIVEDFTNWNNNNYFWDDSVTGDMTIYDDTIFTETGSKYLVLDGSSTGSYPNQLISNFDFTGTNSVSVNFLYYNPADELTSGSDHSGRQAADAVYYTCDGSYWYNIYNFTQNSDYTVVSINITEDANWCGTVNNAFAVKLVQSDGGTWTGDGIAIGYVSFELSSGWENNTYKLDFSDGFEGGYENFITIWDTEKPTTAIADYVSTSGNKSLIMYGSSPPRELKTKMDFSNLTAMKVEFDYYDSADESPAGADHSGTYVGAAFYYTCDGTYWYDLYDLTSAPSGSWEHVVQQIPMSSCPEINSSFALKWTQGDTSTWPADGLAFDSVDFYTKTDENIFYEDVLFYDGFEDDLSNFELYDPNISSYHIGTETAFDGTHAFIMDGDGVMPESELILYKNFSSLGANMNNFILDFYISEAADDSSTGSDHYGLSTGEGFYYTCDGSYWYFLNSILTGTTSWTGFSVNLSADTDWCSNYDKFAMKWSQRDTLAWGSDGIAIDSLRIYEGQVSELETPVYFYDITGDGNVDISNVEIKSGISTEDILDNVSLYIDGSLNITNSSGTNYADYYFYPSIGIGSYVWSIEGCRTDGLCFSSENYTTVVSNYSLEIISPNSSSVADVSTTKNVTVEFFLKNGASSISSGVDNYSFFIGGSEASINKSDAQQYPIFFEDFEDDWVTTSSYYYTGAGSTTSIGNFTGADNNGGDYLWAATTYSGRVYDGTYSLLLDDFDTGYWSYKKGIWYDFDPTTACGGNQCDRVNVNLYSMEVGMDASEYCWIYEIDNNDVKPGYQIIQIYQPVDSYTYFEANVSLLNSDNISVGIICDMSGTTDVTYIDNFNITGFTEDDQTWYDGSNWNTNITAPTGLSGIQDLFMNLTYSSILVNDTSASSISYGAAGDSCTYVSGNWIFDCSENCSVSTGADVSGNNLSFSGTGTITLSDDITGWNQWSIFDGCNVVNLNRLKS